MLGQYRYEKPAASFRPAGFFVPKKRPPGSKSGRASGAPHDRVILEMMTKEVAASKATELYGKFWRLGCGSRDAETANDPRCDPKSRLRLRSAIYERFATASCYAIA